MFIFKNDPAFFSECRFFCYQILVRGGIHLTISAQQFADLSQNYNLIPVYRQWMVDTETPVTVYRKMKSLKPVYLLESVEGGENVTRYSFIGLSPFATFSSNGLEARINRNGKVQQLHGKPLDLLETLLNEYRCPDLPDLPGFYGGAVGYLGYDIITTLEQLPQTTVNDVPLPDTFFALCGIVLIFDHVRHTLIAVVNSKISSNPAADYQQAQKTLAAIEKLLQQNIAPDLSPLPLIKQVRSNCTKDQYINAVNQAKEYIAAGDIFQVVLSQRFTCQYAGDPFQAYRQLRSLNPSPYMYYLDFGDIHIAGASPEMLVRVEGGVVQTRPIAGTRPRGKDEHADNQLAADLLADTKECAEHVMLVDLGRNDLGRVCQPGSVKVASLMQVERYSHVMHIVSSVTGKLAAKKTMLDTLKACFPAGTLSGAPKIRAMEIIDELEQHKRNIYAGAIGYFGYNDVLDTAIAIRTVVFCAGQAYFQAGAGIVADSNPASEYQECLDKATAVARALGIPDLSKEVLAGATDD